MPDRTKPDTEQWYHTTLLSPVKQNLIQAIEKEYYSTWTKLTIDFLTQIYPYQRKQPRATCTKQGRISSTPINKIQ